MLISGNIGYYNSDAADIVCVAHMRDGCCHHADAAMPKMLLIVFHADAADAILRAICYATRDAASHY